MPVVPSSLLEPAWVEFCAVIGGDRREFHPAHPLGCHRRRVPGRVVFEHVVAALVHGSGYERIATRGCSDRTIRRRYVPTVTRRSSTSTCTSPPRSSPCVSSSSVPASATGGTPGPPPSG